MYQVHSSNSHNRICILVYIFFKIFVIFVFVDFSLFVNELSICNPNPYKQKQSNCL